MSLFTAAAQAEQLRIDALDALALALLSETVDDINSAAKIKNWRLNLFNAVIAKTPLC
jgi:hypothetical protein